MFHLFQCANSGTNNIYYYFHLSITFQGAGAQQPGLVMGQANYGYPQF